MTKSLLCYCEMFFIGLAVALWQHVKCVNNYLPFIWHSNFRQSPLTLKLQASDWFDPRDPHNFAC